MYGVIDIGSNTVRLVLYQAEDGQLRPILNNKRAAGLAGYVDKQGCLSEEGIEKLVEILLEFRQITRLLPDCRVYPFATASLRNVCNTDQVLDTIRQCCGMEVRVLTGYEEATLDYRGAARVLGCSSGMMADVGGGSTELVFFQEDCIRAAGSLPLGSLNLYRRYCDGLFPDRKELKAMEQAVCRQVEAAVSVSGALISEPLYAIGGSARGLLVLYRLSAGQPQADTYPAEFLGQVLDLCEKKPKKLLSRILKIAPDRVHTLVPGAALLHVITGLYGSRTIYTSPYGVREGYLEAILQQPQAAAHYVGTEGRSDGLYAEP